LTPWRQMALTALPCEHIAREHAAGTR
jgi:hypothetical protein